MQEEYQLHSLCAQREYLSNSKKKHLSEIEECLKNGIDINLLDKKGHTALYYAVEAGSTYVVNFLLERNANPNLAGDDTFPPLLVASWNNNKNMVLILLDHPYTDINATKKDNATALFGAVQAGNEEIVELLLEQKADQTICVTQPNTSTSPLRKAISDGHIEITKKLIQANPEIVNLESAFSSQKFTPLHKAAYWGFVDLIDILLKNGANINAVSSQNATPLYLAAQNGHKNAVKLLLINGAYYWIGISDTNREVATPLEKAARKKDEELVEELLKYRHTDEALIKALHYSSSQVMKNKDSKKRQKAYNISERLKKELDKRPAQRVLELKDSQKLTWDESFKEIFFVDPTIKDRNPSDRDSAIRYVLATMYQRLQDPGSFTSHVQFLSFVLEDLWNNEEETKGQPFPKFNKKKINFWKHHGLLWIVLNEKFQDVEKFSLLGRLLDNKLNQYGMGGKKVKLTGFIPKEKFQTLLLENASVPENRLTVFGFFHRNMHEVQRVLLLLAIEAGEISLTYTQEDGQKQTLEPKEIFSAIMREDIYPNGVRKNPPWGGFFDTANYKNPSFSDTYRTHSLLLTNEAFSGPFQDYLQFSYCKNFVGFVNLYNHVYKTNYNFSQMRYELDKLRFDLFSGPPPEFAMQMSETRTLEKVKTIDELENDDRTWNIEQRNPKPLKKAVANYGDYLKSFGITKGFSQESLQAATSRLSQQSGHEETVTRLVCRPVASI